MPSTLPVPHRRLLAFACAALALAILAVLPRPADAAPGHGSASITLGPNGKAAKKLTAKKVRVAAKKPAKAKRRGKATTITARAKTADVGNVVDIGLKGGIEFKKGKRKVTVTGLMLEVRSFSTVITGKLAGSRVKVFTAKGNAELSIARAAAELDRAKLSLSGVAAKRIARKLKVKGLSGGRIGTVTLDAYADAPSPPNQNPNPNPNPDPNPNPEPSDLDPYFAECGLSATSEVAGTVPPAPADPTLSGAVPTVGSTVDWGFKQSFRAYLGSTGGSFVGLDGATVEDAPFPPIPGPSGFVFPATGEYLAGPSPDQDRAVIEGAGAVVMCHKEHGFRVTLSNPTIVVDGGQSRLVADVDTNQNGEWIPSQRVELATLDIPSVDPFYNEAGASVTWSDVPVTLTQDGSDVLKLCQPGAPACEYAAGTELDPITIVADTGAATAFPKPATCDLSNTFPDAPTWPSTPANPAPAPSLSGVELLDGGLQWGVRSGLRTGAAVGGLPNPFPVADGAGTGPYVPAGPPGVTAPSYFTWTVPSGEFEAGASNAEHRLVLQGQGVIGICSGHGYGTTVANPTVVIDGDESRLTADVATRYGQFWVRGTVDLVDLDLGSATIGSTTASGETQWSWSFPSSSLTAGGVAVLGIIGSTYAEGLAFDGMTITATVPEAG